MSGLLSASALGFPRQDANETAAEGEILQDSIYFFFSFQRTDDTILFFWNGVLTACKRMLAKPVSFQPKLFRRLSMFARSFARQPA